MEKEKIQELIDYAVMLYSYMPTDEIRKTLIKQGVDEELAMEIVQTIDKSQRKEKKFKGTFSLMGGCGLLVLGVLLTANSYFSADYGERYTIYWKLMLVGFLGILYGVADFIKLNEIKEMNNK